jgi:hypothetical protein
MMAARASYPGDADLVEYVGVGGIAEIVPEICPTSNLLTKHEIRRNSLEFAESAGVW